MSSPCVHSWLMATRPVKPTVEEIKSHVKLNHTPVTREVYEICLRCGAKRKEADS